MSRHSAGALIGRHFAAGGPAFQPTDLGGTVLWLRADLGITLNGSNVSAWADQSGSGNNASQSTGALQPLLVSSSVNGQPAVRMTSTPTYIGGNVSITTTALTAFLVCKRTTGTASARAWALFNGAGANDFDNVGSCVLYDPNAGSLTNYRNGPALATTRPADGSSFYVTSKYDGTNTNIRVSGVDGGTAASTGTFAVTRYLLGCGWSSSAVANFEGSIDVCEFIVYNRALSTTEVSTVESYIHGRYAL